MVCPQDDSVIRPPPDLRYEADDEDDQPLEDLLRELTTVKKNKQKMAGSTTDALTNLKYEAPNQNSRALEDISSELVPKVTNKRRSVNGKSRQTVVKSTPLPANVDVHGYEIIIPDLESYCWRVSLWHTCGHPVPAFIQTSAGADQAQASGSNPSAKRGIIHNAGAACRGLVVEVNKHTLRACMDKCKIKSTRHVVEGRCGHCDG